MFFETLSESVFFARFMFRRGRRRGTFRFELGFSMVSKEEVLNKSDLMSQSGIVAEGSRFIYEK